MIGRASSLASRVRMSTSTSSGRSLIDKFADGIDPTFSRYLIGFQTDQFKPREVTRAHYVPTIPEKVSGKAYFIVGSTDLAEKLGLDPAIFRDDHEERDAFVEAFSGNAVLPRSTPFASIYGCHCYGNWFGQLGDGRAMTIAEVVSPSGERYELQLKGCGRSPFSRGFDGKAVLRSSCREFLASESMYFMGVSTTRALSLVGTGESIRRAWYSSKEPRDASRPAYAGKYPPDKMVVEKGAITTRVARSFIRFAQLELFAKRGEKEELLSLVDYACMREYPELLAPEDYTTNSSSQKGDADHFLPATLAIKPGPLDRYVELYRKIGENAAKLVVNWLRVGYVQGNMNSDNTLIGGRTLDYGPFGFMEKYDPLYQPFTSDQDGKFAFMRQPSAMQMNMVTLSEAFDEVIRYRGEQLGCKQHEVDAALTKINHIVREEFVASFQRQFDDMRASKLGLVQWGKGDNELFAKLDKGMNDSGADYTLFYRLLSDVSCEDDPAEAFSRVEAAFYKEIDYETSSVWLAWFQEYLLRIRQQKDELPDAERKRGMDRVNPKFILRNWMGTLAYEQAENGDFSVLKEMQQCLERPYEEQTEAVSEKYFRKTPPEFVQKPGVAFMS